MRLYSVFRHSSSWFSCADLFWCTYVSSVTTRINRQRFALGVPSTAPIFLLTFICWIYAAIVYWLWYWQVRVGVAFTSKPVTPSRCPSPRLTECLKCRIVRGWSRLSVKLAHAPERALKQALTFRIGRTHQEPQIWPSALLSTQTPSYPLHSMPIHLFHRILTWVTR